MKMKDSFATADEGKFSVEYVEPPAKTGFFSIRERKLYGRVWNLTEDDALELFLKLREKIEQQDGQDG